MIWNKMKCHCCREHVGVENIGNLKNMWTWWEHIGTKKFQNIQHPTSPTFPSKTQLGSLSTICWLTSLATIYIYITFILYHFQPRVMARAQNEWDIMWWLNWNGILSLNTFTWKYSNCQEYESHHFGVLYNFLDLTLIGELSRQKL